MQNSNEHARCQHASERKLACLCRKIHWTQPALLESVWSEQSRMYAHAGIGGSISTERCATAGHVSCMRALDHINVSVPSSRSLVPGCHTSHNQRLSKIHEQIKKGVGYQSIPLPLNHTEILLAELFAMSTICIVLETGRGMGWQELTWMGGEATAEDRSNLDYSVGWQRHELLLPHLNGQGRHSGERGLRAAQDHRVVVRQRSHGGVRVPRQPPRLCNLIPNALPRLPGVEAHGLRPPVPCRGR